jgi:hypothetical protein
VHTFDPKFGSCKFSKKQLQPNIGNHSIHNGLTAPLFDKISCKAILAWLIADFDGLNAN